MYKYNIGDKYKGYEITNIILHTQTTLVSSPHNTGHYFFKYFQSLDNPWVHIYSGSVCLGSEKDPERLPEYIENTRNKFKEALNNPQCNVILATVNQQELAGKKLLRELGFKESGWYYNTSSINNIKLFWYVKTPYPNSNYTRSKEFENQCYIYQSSDCCGLYFLHKFKGLNRYNDPENYNVYRCGKLFVFQQQDYETLVAEKQLNPENCRSVDLGEETWYLTNGKL